MKFLKIRKRIVFNLNTVELYHKWNSPVCCQRHYIYLCLLSLLLLRYIIE